MSHIAPYDADGGTPLPPTPRQIRRPSLRPDYRRRVKKRLVPDTAAVRGIEPVCRELQMGETSRFRGTARVYRSARRLDGWLASTPPASTHRRTQTHTRTGSTFERQRCVREGRGDLSVRGGSRTGERGAGGAVEVEWRGERERERGGGGGRKRYLRKRK